MGRKVTFTIPLVNYSDREGDKMKFSLNKIWAAGPGSQWLRKAKRELWHEEVERIVGSEGIEPFTGRVDITFEFYFRTRYLDSSNCSVMVKLIEDSLVSAGVLENDTNDLVEWIHIRSVQIDKKERKKIEDDYVIVTIDEQNN